MGGHFPNEFTEFGAMDVHLSFEFVGFGATHVHFPYEPLVMHEDWYRPEDHIQELLSWASEWQGPRYAHCLDLFGASQGIKNLICAWLCVIQCSMYRIVLLFQKEVPCV